MSTREYPTCPTAKDVQNLEEKSGIALNQHGEPFRFWKVKDSDGWAAKTFTQGESGLVKVHLRGQASTDCSWAVFHGRKKVIWIIVAYPAEYLARLPDYETVREVFDMLYYGDINNNPLPFVLDEDRLPPASRSYQERVWR